LPDPPAHPGIERASSIKILGIIIDSKLKFHENTTQTVSTCNRSLYALRILRQQGLSEAMLRQVFKDIVLSKLLYASQAWFGFLHKSSLDLYETLLRRAKRFGHYGPTEPSAEELFTDADSKLFNKVQINEYHILHTQLPSKKVTHYNLRPKSLGRLLPEKDNRNFFNRMLYLSIY